MTLRLVLAKDDIIINYLRIFFIVRIPTNEDRKNVWITTIGKHFPDLSLQKYHCLCSLHFEAQYIKSAGKRNILKNKAVPTLFGPTRYSVYY